MSLTVSCRRMSSHKTGRTDRWTKLGWQRNSWLLSESQFKFHTKDNWHSGSQNSDTSQHSWKFYRSYHEVFMVGTAITSKSWHFVQIDNQSPDKKTRYGVPRDYGDQRCQYSSYSSTFLASQHLHRNKISSVFRSRDFRKTDYAPCLCRDITNKCVRMDLQRPLMCNQHAISAAGREKSPRRTKRERTPQHHCISLNAVLRLFRQFRNTLECPSKYPQVCVSSGVHWRFGVCAVINWLQIVLATLHVLMRVSCADLLCWATAVI